MCKGEKGFEVDTLQTTIGRVQMSGESAPIRSSAGSHDSRSPPQVETQGRAVKPWDRLGVSGRTPHNHILGF